MGESQGREEREGRQGGSEGGREGVREGGKEGGRERPFLSYTEFGHLEIAHLVV